MSTNQNDNTPALDPNYQPAQKDSMLTIRFVGNTAQIRYMDAHNTDIDAGQLMAAGEWLKHQAKKMWIAGENAALAAAQEQAEPKISVARGSLSSLIPPDQR